jgi:hypothetical protein
MLASQEVALVFGHHEDRTPTHGYEPTREAAMAAFRNYGEGNRRARVQLDMRKIDL